MNRLLFSVRVLRVLRPNKFAIYVNRFEVVPAIGKQISYVVCMLY